MKLNEDKIVNAFALLALVALLLMAGKVFAGSATVSWTAPTKNTDGSALTDLAGFRVYYGSNPALLDQVAQAPGATTTSATINNLPEGSTWYFAVKAYNTRNAESALSAAASKSFTVPNPPGNVTVASLGYVLELRANGVYRLVRNGSVPLGIPCTPIPGNTGDWLGLAGDRLAVCGPG